MKKLSFVNLNMLDMYKQGIERGKDNTFAIYQRADGRREEYSFNYIDTKCSALIEKLEKAGIKKGDRIGVISSLRPWWYALSYACLKKEYIMVCIDPGVPASQMEKMLVQTEVRAVFTSLNNIHLPDAIVEHVPVYSISEDFPLINKCDKVDFLLSDCVKLPDETFYILFSSGTTSENRKAVLLKSSTVTDAIEYGMSTDAGIYKKTAAYTPRVCDLMLFPPYHIAGLLCATYDFYCNTKIIMLERLTPNNLISVFNDLKPDNICTVPSMLTSLYKKIVSGYSKNIFTKVLVNSLLAISGFFRKNFGLNIGRTLLSSINKQAFGGNMKGFMIGASPFDKETNKFFLNMGIDVSMAYGLTELGAPLAVTGKGYYPGTTGRVLRHTDKMDIRIVNKDKDGRGEVEVLSPYRMITYINAKDNEGCFTDDGYFKTGDLGYFDKDDCLVICGRSKESIVLKNGEKLLPEEIESKYQGITQVKELAVFKVPGEGGCDAFSIAIVKETKNGLPDEVPIIGVNERASKLPQMYRPQDVYVVKEFPLSSSHKVQRFRLTEMVVNGNSEPITDATMIPVDEDEVTGELRKMLVKVAGSSWKNEKLTQGLVLNLDSLTTINLYVEIQDKWGIDLFQLSTIPETFGELLDIVNNFDTFDKKDNSDDLDLSKYPLKYNILSQGITKQVERLVKTLWRVKASGIENLPKDTNYLICPNHRTDIDPAFATMYLPKDVYKNTCIVGKAELINNKAIRKFVVSHNFIPVDRTGNSIKTLNRCKELLMEGRNVLIFPEGTSVQNHVRLLKLKEGAARLSISTNKPIVPCNIYGVAHQEKEMNDFMLPSLKGKIRVRYGEPIYPEGLTVKEINEILKERIEALNDEES